LTGVRDSHQFVYTDIELLR